MDSKAGAYEGGGQGGKLRTRPNRRSAATPYARPSTSARTAPPLEEQQNRWLSKLVDPAARIVARGATKLFSSVFRRQPEALPPLEEAWNVPEAEIGTREEETFVMNYSNPPVEAPSQEDSDGGISRIDGISELEQLLKHKTFSRVEFDQLTELLRTRTIDFSRENKIEEVEFKNQHSALPFDAREGASTIAQNNVIEGSKLFPSVSVPRINSDVSGESMSPTEVAKAYMGSRSSRPSVHISKLHSQSLRESAASPNTPRSSDVSFTPRSAVHFSGFPEKSFLTPRTHGRSALYKMSRSPYFRPPLTAPLKSFETPGANYAGPSSSRWNPSMSSSASKQVLKRTSSVFDNDNLGSFGSMRRTRQKSDVVSPSKDINLNANGVQESNFSMHNSLSLDGQSYGRSSQKDADNLHDKIPSTSFASVPPQSAKVASRILQQLDKLVPSPKEKLLDLKAVTGNKPSSTPSFNILHGGVPKAVSHSYLSNTYNLDSKLSNPSDHSQRSEKNEPIKPVLSRDNEIKEANGNQKAAACGLIFSSAAASQQQTPSFQIQSAEDSVSFGVKSSGAKDISISSSTEKEKQLPALSSRFITSEVPSERNSNRFSSRNEHVLNSMPNNAAANGGLKVPVVFKQDNGFALPSEGSPSQPPFSYNMPASGPTFLEKEQTALPEFRFGSRNATRLIFASTNTILSNMDVPKFNFGLSSKTEMLGSSAAVTTAQTVNNFFDGDKEVSKGNSFEALAHTVFSAVPNDTSAAFGFGLSNNCSSISKASTSPFTGASPAPVSVSNAGFMFSSSDTTLDSSTSSLAISKSAHASTFSTVPSFQVCTDATNTYSSFSAMHQGEMKAQGSKSIDGSPLGLTSSTAANSTNHISGAGNGIFGFNPGAPSSTSLGSTSGSLFGLQSTQPGNSIFNQSSMTPSVSSAAATGVSGNSTVDFSGSLFASPAPGTKSFLFDLTSASNQSSAVLVTAGTGACSPATNSSFVFPITAASLFSSTSQPPNSSIFGSVPSSVSSAPIFSFGSSSVLSSTPSPFSSSSNLAFSFTPSSSGMKQLGSTPGNDQINGDNSMSDDAVQMASPLTSAFGLSGTATVPSNFSVSSPSTQVGNVVGFQFASQQSQSPLQGTGISGLSSGGGFSLGSSDKSNRRIIKVKRDRLGKNRK